MEQIPTINYHDLKSNNVELSKFLEDSLNDVGFFVIKDHPISSESIDKLFNLTQELFDLPLDVKMKYHLNSMKKMVLGNLVLKNTQMITKYLFKRRI